MTDLSMFWVALVLGVVEGLTEFLPISSTGHLILVSSMMGFHGQRAELFQIFIQLGAILAVVWEFRARLIALAVGLPRSRESRDFVLKLGVAFVPVAVVGLLIHDWIQANLFFPLTVAGALIAGGVLILIVESLQLRTTTTRTEATSWPQAVGIGLAQCLALWPGFSRSAATIIGGLAAGLNRRSATEFSFFLAIPTMVAATLYDLYANHEWLQPGDLGWLAFSALIAFVVALVAIRWLLRFVSTHDFRVFAWYRLAVGAVIFIVLNGK